jgi:leader peptidase (prepilin peptidase)/N-methyltransferase
MYWTINALVFYLGAIVGSFLNVCIHRIPREESIVSPPSYCPHCRKPIKPYHNIPILSYIILRGRCRSCRGTISPRYLFVELLTAFCFLALYLLYRETVPLMILYIAFACSLIVAALIDLEHQIIPDEISLPGIAFGIIASVAYPGLQHTDSHLNALTASVIGALVGGGSFWFIRIVGSRIFRREAMGLGDVKLMAYIGALLAWKLVLITTFFAALIGSAAGLFLIAIGRADLGSRLPFGPFLCTGAVLSMLYGRTFIVWYIALFHV